MDNDFATGYALGADSNGGNNNGGNGWGGAWEGIWGIIILAMVFGWGNNGWGGFGGNGGGAGAQGAITRSDLCSEFAFNDLQGAVRGISQGICDSTFALQNSINGLGMNLMQGFNGVDRAVCTLGYQNQAGFNALGNQMAQCCCSLEGAIQGVNYNMATNTCAIQTAMANSTRDIIDSQNAGTRAILDYLCNQEMQNLRSENQGLRLAASQAAQNNVIGARIDAATAEILRGWNNGGCGSCC